MHDRRPEKQLEDESKFRIQVVHRMVLPLSYVFGNEVKLCIIWVDQDLLSKPSREEDFYRLENSKTLRQSCM